MPGTLTRAMPTNEIVLGLLPLGTGGAATGTTVGVPVVVRVAFNLASTATANVSWVNPEYGTVLAKVSYAVAGAAGTGTVHIGRSSDGTGSASQWVSGGTLSAGVHDDEPGNGVIPQWLALGPGNLGTNNSVVGQLNDGVASTMGGCFALITYQLVGT